MAKNPLLSLMYHDIIVEGRYNDSGFRGGDADRYKVDAGAFDRQMSAIKSCGYMAGTVSQALAGAASSMVLTFDDGGIGAMRAADCLDKHGFVGYFFVTTDHVGKAGFLTPAQMQELSSRGHVIGSHSASHPARISSLPEETVRSEWQRSVNSLCETLGSPVDVASVPGGYYSARLGSLAHECGIRTLFTSEPEQRVRQSHGLTTLGRYTVLDSTGCAGVTNLVSGRSFSRQKQYINWNGRKLLKKVAGPLYDKLRRRILSH